MRLIDADALYNSFGASGNCGSCQLDAYKCQYYNEHTLMEFCERIDDAPTVDPVQHGQWIVNDNHHTCRCSCCESVELTDWALEQAKYCPHCGAQMEVEDA